MGLLLDILSQYIFSGISGNTAYDVVRHVLGKVSAKDWETIYLDAFQAAITEMLPILQAYSADGEISLDRAGMSRVLHQDLGATVDTLSVSELSSDVFTTKLAESMQKRAVLIVGGNNLSLEDYKQLVRNLIRHANMGFKDAVLSNETAFKKALLGEIKSNQDISSKILVLLSSCFETTMMRLDIIDRKIEQLRPTKYSDKDMILTKPPSQDLNPAGNHPKGITEYTPLLIGILIDISRSMINTLDNLPRRSGLSRNKLKKAVNTVIEKAILYCKTPESEDVLPKISLFAYGYGFGRFRARVSNVFSRLGIQSEETESVSKPIGPIRDLFAEIAQREELPFTPNVSELDEYLDLYRKGVEAQFADAGIGSSLLFEGLQVAYDRFFQELVNPYYEHPILLLISDGDTTGGSDEDMNQVVLGLKQLGIQIVCCYVGSKNITKPKTLYSNADGKWPQGALRLFSFASNTSEPNQITHGMIEMARENGWQVPDKARLFIQINQSRTLEELVDFILSSLKD